MNPKVYHRMRSCQTKVRYRTHRHALDQLNFMHLRHLVKESGRSLSIYRCKFCEGWHLGHKGPLEQPVSVAP